MSENLFDFFKEQNEPYSTHIAIDWLKFSSEISVALNNASQLTRLPLSGDRWEELLVVVFERIGNKVHWQPGSHAPGADIQLLQEGLPTVKISVKAGSLAKRKTGERALKFSSYRLTRHSSLEAKVKFIDKDADEIDWYLFGAREDTLAARRYYVYLTKATVIQAVQATWQETTGGWLGKQENGVVLSITRSMSDQLWVDIPLELINNQPNQLVEGAMGVLLATVTIPINQLGSRIDLLFSNFFDQKPGGE